MIPTGNISLEEAVKLYAAKCGGGIPPYEVGETEERERWWIVQQLRQDIIARSFSVPFMEGTLVAVVFNPTLNREFEIGRSQWQQIVGESFWDVTILSGRINFGCDPVFSQYRGLTAYTRWDSFLAWLGNGEEQQAQQNVPVWKRASRQDLQEWYSDWTSGGATAWLKRNGRASITPTEDDDLAAARETFGETVTRDMIRDNRRAIAPAEWKRKGRKSRQR